MENVKKKINYKILFLVTCIIMMIPSVIYLCKNKTILNFTEWFTFFLHNPSNYIESVLGALIYGILFILLIYFYFKILKNSNQEFTSIKKVIFFVLTVALVFGIMVPFTSSDVYYYMGTGWLNCHYGENPYYTSVHEVRMQNLGDEILQRTGVWENQVVVYGPLWVLICKILSFLSFGKVTLCLYVYKISAILVHVFNTIIIYKITKKKKFALLYGINPFILFEMITNVHNDLYLIAFILIALYFLLKKKNIYLTIIFMALATCIKYVSVLLIPFMVLYYLKDKKISQKILYSFLYALLFIFIMLAVYLIYAKDISMIFTITMQQSKYREGILTILLEISSKTGINILNYGKILFFAICILVAIDGMAYMFFYKKINISSTIRKYNNLLFAFLFLLITNLCPWYTSWLTPTIFWLKGKNIKNMLYIQFAYELVVLLNFALHSESYKIGLWFLPIMLCIVIIFNVIDNINKKLGGNFGKISFNRWK